MKKISLPNSKHLFNFTNRLKLKFKNNILNIIIHFINFIKNTESYEPLVTINYTNLLLIKTIKQNIFMRINF